MTTPREHADDKTEQTVTNEPRGTAAGGSAVIINVPGCPLMVRAVDYNTLRAEKDRLTACLEKANINAENFEREWYLRGDELDNLRAQLAEAQRDAERYRSLRRGQKWSVIDWKGDALRADDLDAAIDAAKEQT